MPTFTFAALALCVTFAQRACANDASLGRGLHSGTLLTSDSVGKCIQSMEAASREGTPLIDVVITWWTKTFQSDRHTALSASSILESSFENQMEIKYLLRSYQEHGLLDHIRNIYVLVDREVLDKHGAPRGLRYDTPVGDHGEVQVVLPASGGKAASSHTVRIVSDDTTGSDEFTGEWLRYNKRMQGVHRIPGLSEFFLITPDDAFLTKDVRSDADFVRTFFHSTELADGQGQPGASSFFSLHRASTASTAVGHRVLTPVMYTFGTVGLGDCLGQGSVGAGHGPVLASKSVWAGLDESVFRTRPSSHELSYEAICVYQHAMRDTFGAPFKGYYGSNVDGPDGQTFFVECHTNDKCLKPADMATSIFANIQGNGISDEYGFAPDPVWAQWFHTNYPRPSIFEEP